MHSEAVKFLLVDDQEDNLACLEDALARDGLGVIVVLHDLTLAARWADSAVLLDAGGRPVAAGSAADTLAPATLQGVFGVGFERLATASGEPVIIPNATAMNH